MRASRRNDVVMSRPPFSLFSGRTPEPGKYRWARTCLLRLGVDLSGEAPPGDGVQHFQSILSQQAGFPTLWTGVSQVRTYGGAGRLVSGCAQGRQAVAWMPGSTARSARGVASPRGSTHIGADASETAGATRLESGSVLAATSRCRRTRSFKLQSIGIATAKNCCRRIVIWPGV